MSFISTPNVVGATATSSADTDAVYRKVTVRLITFFCLCYFAAYLDRINVGLAKLQMLSALQFSDTVYGLGAGLFFAGYILFEVPSNLILQKVGAKLWIARIMVTWGLISGATAFVTTPTQFYVLRFLLGVAEAGFLPGVLLYLTRWYPDERRARIIALFMVGLPLSSMIGSPLSGWIMQMFDGAHGFGGWQWLFVIEAIPSVVLGIAIFMYLPNDIASARWLTAQEKAILVANLDKDAGVHKRHNIGAAFSDLKVWMLGLIDLCVLLGLYGVSFWLPTILKDTGVKDPYTIGWLMAIPNALAVVGVLVWGARSDRLRQRLARHGDDGRAVLADQSGRGGGDAGGVGGAVDLPQGRGCGGRHCVRMFAREPRGLSEHLLHRLVARHVPFPIGRHLWLWRVHADRLRAGIGVSEARRESMRTS